MPDPEEPGGEAIAQAPMTTVTHELVDEAEHGGKQRAVLVLGKLFVQLQNGTDQLDVRVQLCLTVL